MRNQELLMEWAECQWGGCLLGDKRRTSRIVRVGFAMASRSSMSIPAQMQDWASIKAAYRLFGMEKVTHESVSAPHWEQTRSRARASGQGIVLFIQDLTELDFGSKPDSFELGFVGSTYGRGIEVQTTLCVVPFQDHQAEILGLALQTPWVREHAPRQKIEPQYERTKRRTEYDVWKESIEEIGPAPSPESGTIWVSVGDRGSDIFSHLWAATELGWKCLVRSKHDRKLEDQKALHKQVRSLEPLGSTSICIRSRPGQKSRTAHLHISYMAVKLPSTFKSKSLPALDITCIRVWEAPSANVANPIEWILLTTLNVDSFADALRAVELYRYRWLIEEYHKCLKSGCQIERRHLNHRDKLLALLGVLSIVSVMLLQLKSPSKSLKPPNDLRTIVQALTDAKEDLSLPNALLRRIAMLGGFIGRKGDGEPGWQTVWKGWTRIQDILTGMQIAERNTCG